METKTAWQEDLSLGIGEVDGEHQLQVRLLSTLQEAISGGRPAGIVSEILQRVEDTSNVHFMSEELLMRLHAYERYALHVEEHRQLLEQFRDLRRHIEAGPAAAAAAAVEQLTRWLTGHIRGADRAFTEWVRTGGAASA
jgi:hemerythrin-like metal-binding protein